MVVNNYHFPTYFLLLIFIAIHVSHLNGCRAGFPRSEFKSVEDLKSVEYSGTSFELAEKT